MCSSQAHCILLFLPHLTTFQTPQHNFVPFVGKTTMFVKNSAEFARFMRQHTVQKDEVMVSFDDVFLFTKITVDLAVSVATLKGRTFLSPNEISFLLSFCLNATYFTFRRTFFKQIFGIAMGSPVPVVTAKLVMEDVEQKVLCFLRFTLPLCKRYVDDTFTIIRRDMLMDLHNHLNSINESI